MFKFCRNVWMFYISQFLICSHVKTWRNALFYFFVHMFKFWRNVCNDSYFAICDRVCMLKYNEMFCFIFLFTCSNFDEMFTIIRISQFAISFDMLESCLMFDETFRLFVLFDQHMFWDVFHQNVRSKVVFSFDSTKRTNNLRDIIFSSRRVNVDVTYQK